MKAIKIILFLLIPFLSLSQDYNVSSKSFNTWAAMIAEPGTNNIVVTLNGLLTPGDGGGDRKFRWNDTSTKTPMYGMVGQVSGISTGRWEFIYNGGDFNYLWFGGIGDGVTYNNKLQSSIDWIVKNYPGGTLYFPPGTYLDTSHALAKTGCNIKGAGRFMSKLKNDLAVRTGAGFGYQSPLRWGNMGPSDWDTIVMKSYRYDSIVSGGSKIVMHSMPDSVQVGKIMLVRSSGYWANARGLIKSYVTRLMRITKRDADSAWFEHPIDTIVANGNFSMEMDFKNNVNKTDNWGQIKRWICDINVSDIGLISSNGQIALGNMEYQCTFNRIYTYGYESLGGNGQAWCKFNDLFIEWWKQVWENSVGSHDNLISNVHANWVPRTDGLKPNSKQPFIKFGENVYNISMINFDVNAGDFTGRIVWFGSATRCSFSKFSVVAKNIRSNCIYFSTTDQDPDDDTDDFNVASIVSNNFVKDGIITTNRTNRVQQFIYYFKPITLGQLYNNTVDNVYFYGTPTQNAVKFDGGQSVVRSCWFENGDIAYGDSVSNGSVENSWIPEAILPTSGNVTFLNVRTPGAVLNSVVAGDYRPRLKYITVDTSLTTATLTGSGIKLPVAANKYYTLVGTLRTGCTGTNGIALSFSAPSGSFMAGGNITGSGTSSNNNPATAKIAVFGTAAGGNFNKFIGNGGLQFQMSFTTSSTAGFVEVLFASDGTATSTIQGNSYISLQENNIYSP